MNIEVWGKYLEEFTEKPATRTHFAHKSLDELIDLDKWDCPIIVKLSDKAYYSPLTDHIVMPKKSQFPEAKNFYMTLLHEMSHSTGHKSRLARELGRGMGSPEYGKEELIAELTAAITGAHLGISVTPSDQNIGYLRSWLDNIKKNPEYLQEIIPQVNRACRYMLDYVSDETHDITAI